MDRSERLYRRPWSAQPRSPTTLSAVPQPRLTIPAYLVAAVDTNEAGHPQRVKLTMVEGFRLNEIVAWAQQHLSLGTQVLSDGLTCFNGVTAGRLRA